jgi:hypothetical protein
LFLAQFLSCLFLVISCLYCKTFFGEIPRKKGDTTRNCCSDIDKAQHIVENKRKVCPFVSNKSEKRRCKNTEPGMMENLAARKIRKEKEAAFAPLPMVFSLGETCL